MISETNKKKRLDFATQCISDKDSFDDIIWTDESSIQLVRHTRSVRVKVGKEKHYKPVSKHAVKVLCGPESQSVEQQRSVFLII